MHVRWLIRRDMPTILELEARTKPEPLTESEIVKHLRLRNVIGLVAGDDDIIEGYVLYTLHKKHLDIFRMCVYHEGAAFSLVNHLSQKLYLPRRTHMDVHISLSDLPILNAMKAFGFVAYSCDGDTVNMTYYKD